ncbi:MAG: sulfatase family protein [Acidimicrobiales bacterium]
MGRKILFVTTDQQRYDTLGCNGGTLARTPVIDALAAEGIRYERAHPQSVVCMPSRATMLTGQYPTTHGVWMNGVPLPIDAPSVAEALRRHGYRTALVGKAHFEPFLDPFLRFPENAQAGIGTVPPGGVHRGFEHLELATHGSIGPLHYARWLAREHPEAVAGFYRPLDSSLQVNAEGGGDTGAPQVKVNPVERGVYHTDWVADRAIDWLDGLEADDDWFCWMSFPDPHHPWDPPATESRKISWRDLDLPAGHPGSVDACVKILSEKPSHWLGYFDGSFSNLEGGPAEFVPQLMTHDQVREVNALVHAENQLIDAALGRVLAYVSSRGWDSDTDVFFTTDHGELQGDFGLLFKGSYHCDALMHLPMIWRPAPSAGIAPAEVPEPVGQIDLAATFCHIAGLPLAPWIQGEVLPTAPGSRRERVITEWDSQFPDVDFHLRSIYADGWLATAYEAGGRYDGTEGELYDVAEDPQQWHNRWDDPACQARRSDMIADLYDHLPEPRQPRLEVEAPV